MTNKLQSKKTRTDKNAPANAPIDGARTSGSSTAAGEPAAKAESKIARVVTLLRRPIGATLPEIVDATAWQPHSARAALTGLKKKGHSLERTKRDEATCYRIVEDGRS